MINILRIEYKEDLAKIGNQDVLRYIEDEINYLCEIYGFEWEFDAFSNYGIGELILIEKQNEIPLFLPFEYVEKHKIGHTELYDAGYLRNNEEILSYIIPSDILEPEIKELLEREIYVTLKCDFFCHIFLYHYDDVINFVIAFYIDQLITTIL